MKKRIAFAMILALFAVLLLTTCSNSAQTSPSNSPESSTTSGTTDAVSSASVKESSDPEKLIAGLSDTGYWIFAVLSDVTLRDELVISGIFHNRNDESDRVYRKFSLYSQDESYTVTAEYTLTVPKITVLSPNLRIQNGTVKGDIYVDAEGLELFNSTLDGNLTFKTQTQMDSAELGTATITGTISVEE